MTVTALFFGHFKDVYPTGLSIQITEGASVGDLMLLLVKGESRLKGLDKICRIAVNLEFCSPETLLSQDDEVAFIPPTSGG